MGQQQSGELPNTSLNSQVLASEQHIALTFLVTVLVIAGVCAAWLPLYTAAGILALSVFASVCSEKRLKYALFALAAYTPFEPFLLNFVPAELFLAARFGPYAFLGACFGLILLRRFLDGRPLWFRTPIDLPIFLFLCISTVSLLLNGVPVRAALFSFQPFLRFIMIIFFPVMFIEFDRDDVVRLMKLLFFVAFLEALISIAQAAIGISASEFLAPVGAAHGDQHVVGGMTQVVRGGLFRIFGTMGRYNNLAGFIGIVILLSIPLYLRFDRSRAKFILLYCAILPPFVLSGARAPWLAVLVGAWCIFLMLGKPEAIIVPLLAFLFVLTLPFLAGGIAYYGWQDEASSLQRLLEPFSDQYRTISVQSGRMYYLFSFPFDMWREGPKTFLFGLGPGSLGARAVDIFDLDSLEGIVALSRQERTMVTDVNWAYIFGQTGLAGLACIIWACIRLFRIALVGYQDMQDPILQSLGLGFVGIVPFFAVFALFYPVWEIRSLSLYFWLFAALTVKLSQNARTQEKAVQAYTDPDHAT